MLHARLERLPSRDLGSGILLFEARGARARLLGLAGLPPLDPLQALVLHRCRAIHTFGMRFPLDVIFLDARGQPVRIVRGLRPRRLAACTAAHAVIEAAAGQGNRILERLDHASDRPGRTNRIPPMAEERSESKVLVGLDPRRPIYRDAYNEYFVLVLSAGGAAAGTQVPLYIAMALTDLWSLGVFVGACVVFELAVIFGLARPQMTPKERLGWAALWGGTTALLALCFYYLVAEPTL